MTELRLVSSQHHPQSGNLDPTWRFQIEPNDHRVLAADPAETSINEGSVGFAVWQTPRPFAGDTQLVTSAVWNGLADRICDVGAEAWRILEPGGRIAVFADGLGYQPYRSVPALTGEILSELGFVVRAEIVWIHNPQLPESGGAASPHNPPLRETSSRVLIAQKLQSTRWGSTLERSAAGLPSEVDVTAEAWVRDTADVLVESGDPGSIPVGLARRLIGVHTYRGDLVVDLSCRRSGTSIAAVTAGRRFIGVTTDPDNAATVNRQLRLMSTSGADAG